MNLHRVAVMEVTQVIMDIEAENDLDSIKKRALEAYFNEDGEPERGYSFPAQVVVYPWLEEGQLPPKGSDYPKPTILEVAPKDIDLQGCDNDECECHDKAPQEGAKIIPFPTRG